MWQTVQGAANTVRSVSHTWHDNFVESTASWKKNSDFRESGEINPQEFEAAGQHLVKTYQKWSWCGGERVSSNKLLPDVDFGHQYLVQRDAICRRRYRVEEGEEVEGDELKKKGNEEKVDEEKGQDPVSDEWAKGGDDHEWRRAGWTRSQKEEEEELPDLSDASSDSQVAIRQPEDTDCRYYDLYVTYSKKRAAPRFYLSGYNHRREPLAPNLMMQDVATENRGMTVSLEDFPLFDMGIKMLSIHPCKHTELMKALMDHSDEALKQKQGRLREEARARKTAAEMEKLPEKMESTTMKDESREHESKPDADGGEEFVVLESDDEDFAMGETPRAYGGHEYLILFVKIMTSVAPTIECIF